MMDLEVLQDQIFDAVQRQREMKEMNEFRVGDPSYLHNTYNEVKHVAFLVSEMEGDNQLSAILTEFMNILDDSERGDEEQEVIHSASLDAVILDRRATHLSVHATVDFPQVSLEFKLFYHYIDLEPVGPMIDGDIVLQGTSADFHFGPALCAVESLEDDFPTEVAWVTPAKMIITTGESADSGEDGLEPIKFVIPVAVPPQYQTKSIQLKVFCAPISSIKYDNLDENLEEILSSSFRSEMILSNVVIPQLEAAKGESKLEAAIENIDAETEYHGRLVIKNIRVATDYDEVISSQNEGMELCCTLITPEGTVSDQDHIWKFHVLAEFGPPDEAGLEDIMFIKCLKSLGTLPSIPFFEVLHDYDLSRPENDYSVYLATKLGMNPRFKKLVMISCEMQHEEALERYMANINGIFRLAPPELDKAMDGHCGLLMSYDTVIPDTVPKRELTDVPSQLTRRQSVRTPKQDDSGRHSPSLEDHSEEEDEEDEDVYIDEEEVIRQLQQQIMDLEAEKKTLTSQNYDLQKKAVTLMTKEKALQGQAIPGGTATTRPPETAGGEDPNNATAAQPVEQNLEKEKQYQDVLVLIVEERKKLNKQLKEFDQLALDLQTRLDDKEFKAKSIATSFKSFKKEILSKAENSRTGHPISKPQILQIENSEAKHEEDLEKIRLRNISLKSLQKKLEKTLRQREQLAEGLHMIDFEQLKIENQTLNEKIEERNEELSKLKRKKTLTVQILTHIREKLRYVEQSNRALQAKVNDLESYITTKRNSVTVKKLERDNLRTENKEYKAKQGFASSDLLLVDYEKRKYQTQEIHANIMELKNRYDLLTKQMQFSSSQILSSSMSGGAKSQGLLMGLSGPTQAFNPSDLQISRGMNDSGPNKLSQSGRNTLSR